MNPDLKPRIHRLQPPGFTVHRSTQGPFFNNAYLIVDDATRRCALLDPFYEADRLWPPLIEGEGLTLESILITHGHIDHVAGVAAMRRAYPSAAVLIHEPGVPLMTGRDTRLLLGSQGSLQAFEAEHGFPPFEPAEPTGLLIPGQPVDVGSLRFEVLDTPGHCPGHVSFLYGRSLLSGDVLFRGAVGYTNIPGSDEATLAATILNVLLPLGDDVTVFPGHANRTTIGHERATNPFILKALAAAQAAPRSGAGTGA